MSRLPARDDILRWVAENPAQASGRDIARAFGVRGAERPALRRLLKEMQAEGCLPGPGPGAGPRRHRTGPSRAPDALPPVSLLRILPPDADGDLFAQPRDWQGDQQQAPLVLMVAPPSSGPALGPGDIVLARLTGVSGEAHRYEGRLIRRIGSADGPARLLGIFRGNAERGRITPVDKKRGGEWIVPAGATLNATDGELVEAERTGARARTGLSAARIVRRLGDPSRALSLIAIRQHGIPQAFPDPAVAEAARAAPAPPDGREDLRELPFLTIDPADARDHDDACYAHPDDHPDNPGGHVVWVAIADVAHYVRPGSALDGAARDRGNSTYFPDRVVPMLPDRLSGDLCSLRAGCSRPCIAVRMVLDAGGRKIGHRFVRGLMRSVAALTYGQAQAAIDGGPDEGAGPLLRPLYAAYEAVKVARTARQPLDLDLPERKVVLDERGGVVSVDFRERLDAHRLIEEFMVLANIAAAEELTRRGRPLLFRVHEAPDAGRLETLRDAARAAGLPFVRGAGVKTRHLNRLLEAARGTAHAETISMAVLRSMTQACYAPENGGHFGLALAGYAHFTSPIRRYADLVVHRALIAAHGWGEDGLTGAEAARLAETAALVSERERRSLVAERDTTDRYLAARLAGRVGEEMAGRVSGVVRFGLFVRLSEDGADALVPMASLGQRFRFDARTQRMVGRRSGAVIGTGQAVTVRLTRADPMTGGLVAELLAVDGAPVAGAGGGRKVAGGQRKAGAGGGRPGANPAPAGRRRRR